MTSIILKHFERAMESKQTNKQTNLSYVWILIYHTKISTHE